MKKIIIAIDGHSGCGKSSTARALAKRLNYAYIDTGAMYRAVTLYLLRSNTDLTDTATILKHLPNLAIRFKYSSQTNTNDTFLNGENVEQEIRSMSVSECVSEVSAIAQVRQLLVAQQQDMGREKGIILDGRDIGTVVFPDAELKIFMTASVLERAKRRQKELARKGEKVDLKTIRLNFEKRDYIDSNRTESPLCKAENAIIIDTTSLNFEEQVTQIAKLAEEIIHSE